FDRNPRYLVNGFDNAEKNGLVFLRCENSSVSDNTISGVWKKRAALDIQGCDRFRVSNNSVLDSDGAGIRLEKVTNSSVIGNLVRDDRPAEKRSKEPSIAVIGGKANMIELNNLQNKLVAR
ncbi:MAG: NosD domain-containing protein, partial [Bacteroidota bacterium]